MNRAIIEMAVPGAIVCGEATARFFPKLIYKLEKKELIQKPSYEGFFC